MQALVIAGFGMANVYFDRNCSNNLLENVGKEIHFLVDSVSFRFSKQTESQNTRYVLCQLFSFQKT